MSFIAGYIAGLDEGGSTYINEQKTITSNGEYKPDDGVRWDKVTVDVPQTANMFDSMRTIWSATLMNKWCFFIKTDEGCNLQPDPYHIIQWHTYGNDRVYFAGEDYINNTYLCLYDTQMNFFGARLLMPYPYQSSWNYGTLETGLTSFKEHEQNVRVLGVENANITVRNYGYKGLPYFSGVIHFSVEIISRNNQTGEVTRHTTEFLSRDFNNDFELTYSNVFTGLSPQSRFDKWLEMGRDLLTIAV